MQTLLEIIDISGTDLISEILETKKVPMILKAYNKSEIARLYFQKKGENLTTIEAGNRWRMITPDAKVLKSVFKDVYQKQISIFE
jgi:hypothetical protein